MPGFIYFFSTFGDRTVFKAGRTDQESLAARFKSYLGPSKPRMVVASREVDDTVAAEDMMLRLLRSSRVLQARPDLGVAGTYQAGQMEPHIWRIYWQWIRFPILGALAMIIIACLDTFVATRR